ncbi:TetR/AcrR family transcriptional regulator [Enemella evansiae]|uniref:TetR/AcrR family transcriptional regulator n=1 Tax=Enemella evansiae TaxID=2016499 RepID=UPI001E4DA6CB|nr:TetR/AcrR family transcriptional regulator [Enemella evansiae]
MTTAASAGPDRGARRRARNRKRLVDAAAELMATGGAEALTISAITEGADLGAGTFYNYFTSREEIITAIVADAVETLGVRLDALTRDLQDAAEIYSFSVRHLVGMAVTDPLWGRMVVRLGVAHDQLNAALGPRARRDLQIGLDAGRFRIPDLDVATAVTFGALLSAMHVHLSGDRSADPSSTVAELLLRMVGVPAEEAYEVTRRPLPPLPSVDRAREILAPHR